MSNNKQKHLIDAISCNFSARQAYLAQVVTRNIAADVTFSHFNQVANNLMPGQRQDLLDHASAPQRYAMLNSHNWAADMWQGFVDLPIKKQSIKYMADAIAADVNLFPTKEERDNVLVEAVCSDVAHADIAFDNLKLVLGTRPVHDPFPLAITPERVEEVRTHFYPPIIQSARDVCDILGRDFDQAVGKQRDLLVAKKFKGSDYYTPLTPGIWPCLAK